MNQPSLNPLSTCLDLLSSLVATQPGCFLRVELDCRRLIGIKVPPLAVESIVNFVLLCRCCVCHDLTFFPSSTWLYCRSLYLSRRLREHRRASRLDSQPSAGDAEDGTSDGKYIRI